MNPLPPDYDVGTTMLQESCMKRIELRVLGKSIGEMPGALYKGNVGHAALEQLHREPAETWCEATVERCVAQGVRETEQRAEDENRPMTEAVVKDQQDTSKELTALINHYVERRRDYIAKSEVLGVEVPIRWKEELDGVAGGPVSFASHVDLLYRDPDGQLVIADFKFKAESPTMAYLSRSLQLGAYFIACAYGRVMLDQGGITERWVSLGEYAEAELIDMLQFKPYNRATMVVDKETGEEIRYSKGDVRPLRNIIKRFSFLPEKENTIKSRIAERVLLMRAGIWPANPDPLGCHFCDVRMACDNFNSMKGIES